MQDYQAGSVTSISCFFYGWENNNLCYVSLFKSIAL